MSACKLQSHPTNTRQAFRESIIERCLPSSEDHGGGREELTECLTSSEDHGGGREELTVLPSFGAVLFFSSVSMLLFVD